MNCPGCNQPAKESEAYPGTFVCRCLGHVEDIKLIPGKMGPQPQAGLIDDLVLSDVSDIDSLIAIGKELRNAAGGQSLAQSYLNDGTCLKVSKNNQLLYLIWIKHDKLIPAGMYFGKRNNEYPSDEDRKNFKKVTQSLIQQGRLLPQIFSDVNNDRSKFLLN